MSILGNRVLRVEDPRFLRGEGRYLENMPLEGALVVTFVRSPLAHARINGVDTSAAEALPNVQVLTGADVDAPPFGPPPYWNINPGMVRPMVATDIVRFAGEIVAIVVSEDRASGVDAAELVMVDYDPLPVVVTVADAAKDETLLFPGEGTNVAARAGSQEHDEDLFEDCDVVVSDSVWSQRMAAAPMESRSAAAEVDADGRLTVWLTSQTPQRPRWSSPACSGSIPGRCGSSPTTSAAASARSSSRSRECSSPGSPVSSGARPGGRRRGRRTWSRFSTAVRCSSTSRSAGRGTARCSRTGSKLSPTRARTRSSARSFPT